MSSIDEATLWDRLSNARRIPLNPAWLGEIFSPSLSDELRFAVAERLGMQQLSFFEEFFVVIITMLLQIEHFTNLI